MAFKVITGASRLCKRHLATLTLGDEKKVRALSQNKHDLFYKFLFIIWLGAGFRSTPLTQTPATIFVLSCMMAACLLGKLWNIVGPLSQLTARLFATTHYRNACWISSPPSAFQSYDFTLGWEFEKIVVKCFQLLFISGGLRELFPKVKVNSCIYPSNMGVRNLLFGVWHQCIPMLMTLLLSVAEYLPEAS